MQTRKKQFEEDDGRVIANMDVDGMPWHDRRARFEERLDQRAQRTQRAQMYGERMTKSEARQYTFYALLAGMVIVAVFAGVWGLLILFMTQVWFR